jgi:prevent-host-death family protein
MGESVGIRELQQHASKVVARAAAGESVEITDRGRPVARLVPMHATPTEDLVASGRLRPARRPLDELPPLVEPPPGAPSASEILALLRAAER